MRWPLRPPSDRRGAKVTAKGVNIAPPVSAANIAVATAGNIAAEVVVASIAAGAAEAVAAIVAGVAAEEVEGAAAAIATATGDRLMAPVVSRPALLARRWSLD